MIYFLFKILLCIKTRMDVNIYNTFLNTPNAIITSMKIYYMYIKFKA